MTQKGNSTMARIELTDLERSKLAAAGRGFASKHRSAQEIEIAELKNAFAMARQKKTLRDEFAMAAITGVMNKYESILPELIAKDAYAVADAMMKERVSDR
jgi:cytochrome c-type biogenesis protein CcmE